MNSPVTNTSSLPDILDVSDLASLLRLHRVTIRLKAASGEIPGRQIGNRWRFSRERIMEWMMARKEWMMARK